MITAVRSPSCSASIGDKIERRADDLQPELAARVLESVAMAKRQVLVGLARPVAQP
jgi:hypothetical protein